ncbi:MAG: hypothetical protein A2X86_06840 [Bdellovibrionales bacterium GWA2_49_15]|nr:MAG: hypothetical protein A2X86_06840 [Bdellovibrionales bacterium GWA2_49_15]HAZ12009.1 hypothetical protein [Bdellovibrionales bacterium]
MICKRFKSVGTWWALSFVCLCLAGCFKKDAPLESDSYDVGNFQNSCKIDADRLKKLLEVDVTADITCVENNLKQFSEFVNRPDSNIVRREDLEKFINKFFVKESNAMIKSLRFLFELNTLLLRDQRHQISVQNIHNIFDLVRMANRFGAPINHILKKIVDEKKNYWDFRPQIEYLLTNLTKDFVEILGRARGPSSQLNVMEFITELKKSMDLSDDQFDLELIESFLFVKKLFIGGDRATISTDEITAIIPKVGQAVLLVFDFVYYLDANAPEKKDKALFFLQRTRLLGNLFYPWGADEHIFKHNELINVVEKLTEGKFDFKIRNIEESIVNVKTKLIGSDANIYTFGDINKVLSWGVAVFEQYYFNDITFEYMKDAMESPDPLKDLVRPELPEYAEFARPRVFELWTEFKAIVTQYRVFHSPENIQYYSNSYKRFLYGINLQTVLRFGLGKALAAYGHPKIDPATGKPLFMAATINELRTLLLDVKTAMVEFDLWPHFFERFLSEAMNSSDLFQYQSDGDGLIRLDEATEYVANILSSRTLALDMYEALKAHCPVVDVENKSFEVQCYRQYFFSTLMNDLKYERYFPKLYDYLVFSPDAEIEQFLISVESFAKEIRDINVPMSTVDIGRLFVSLSNIETTFIRYDMNYNNIMDRDEIEQGWIVFKQTIMGFAKLKPSQETLGKSIYLFILKKMKVPSTIEAVFFHLFGNKKDVTARRLNIGAILALVAEATIGE